MAELATIARPYAEALFEVAQAGDLPVWSAFVQELSGVARMPEVLALSNDPKVSRAEVVELLMSVVKAPAGDAARNFVAMVVDNHRIEALPAVAVQLEEMRNAREGAADVEIASAFPLEGASLAGLVATLERRFGRKLKPHVTVDPSLIGGVCVTIGDEVLDTSVRARLAQMRTALTA
jgi:F-type H+-transporting ATPase subunit delta